jgi:hypothetical protein
VLCGSDVASWLKRPDVSLNLAFAVATFLWCIYRVLAFLDR